MTAPGADAAVFSLSARLYASPTLDKALVKKGASTQEATKLWIDPGKALVAVRDEGSDHDLFFLADSVRSRAGSAEVKLVQSASAPACWVSHDKLLGEDDCVAWPSW